MTTFIGAEGMQRHCQEVTVDSGWGGSVCSSATEFAAEAALLYNNAAKFQKGQQNAASILNDLFEEQKNSCRLFERVDTLTRNLQEVRKRNTVGSMLKYCFISPTFAL